MTDLKYLPKKLENLESANHEAIDKAVESMKSNEMTTIPHAEFNFKAYKLLLKCVLKEDMIVWNEYATKQGKLINLFGAVLSLELYRLNLRGVNLELTNLRGANLQGADLQGANLKRANLELANLQGANLQGANLWGTEFQTASLMRANLQGTNLDYKQLNNAKERGAIVDDSKDRRKYLFPMTIRVIGVLASVLTLGAAIFMAVNLVIPEKDFFVKRELPTEINKKEYYQQVKKIKELEMNLVQIKKQLHSMSSLPDSRGWKIVTSKMQTKINSIEKKINALESALTIDPIKSLAVPMLRKDLDNAEKNIKIKLEQYEIAVNRIYVQNNLLIGLIITIALTVFGVTVAAFFNRKSS